MKTDREVMQQALEALEYENSWHEHHKLKPFVSTLDAIKDLRARLAEPETCKPALQVEEVEPVAHRHEWFRTGAMEPGQMRCIECGEWGRRIPAPARRPLTDEEILKAVGWETAEMYFKLTPGFPVAEARAETLKNARAIERAHKIGGNDE